MEQRTVRSVICIIIFAQIGFSGAISFNYGDLMELLNIGREITMDVLESWDMIEHRKPGMSGTDTFLVKGMERRLMKRMSDIADKLDNYEKAMEMRLDSMLSEIIHAIPTQVALERTIMQFQNLIGQIDDKYSDFLEYIKTDKFERTTIINFAQSCVSNQFGQLPDTLRSVHRLLVPQKNNFVDINLLTLLAKAQQEASTHSCNKEQSAQQLLLNLYTTVALTEIKGYAMIQFSYELLRLYENGTTYNEEINSLKQQYAERTYETLRAVKTAMTFAPRDLWMCDPAKHILEKTYTELKQVFQGYIVNEVDLNMENTCRENCGYYSYAKVHGCFKNQFCGQQRQCTGKVVNCEYVDSDMWICPSEKNSARRYEYIEYENGKNFGQKDTCRKPTIKVDSWWRWLFWHCSYCFCYCDDHSVNSERYFNLRQVVSDIQNHKVVTGLKLIKDKQIIHIQIQEGELLAKGGINDSTVTWKPIDSYSVSDQNVNNAVDYHTIVWEKRGIDLDDLVSPDGYLLTGVRFRTVGTRLNLEIRVSPFNFTSGKLISPEEKSYWISNDNTDRTELKLANSDIPIRSALESMPDSKINQYLNFAASDREKDAAQSTVPFIDVQPVVPNPLIPLSGAGIYHKGREGSGGFLGIKVITYDFGPHLKADVPPTTPLIETRNEIISA